MWKFNKGSFENLYDLDYNNTNYNLFDANSVIYGMPKSSINFPTCHRTLAVNIRPTQISRNLLWP